MHLYQNTNGAGQVQRKLSIITKTALVIGLILHESSSMEQSTSHKNSQSRILEVTSVFPGHTSTEIEGDVNVSDYFDPADYQQDKLRKEAVCVFNSLLAGIMHTEYGRNKVKQIIEHQDDNHVYIRFYFPTSDTLKNRIKFKEIKRVAMRQGAIDKYKAELLSPNQDTDIDYLNEQIEACEKLNSNDKIVWEKFFLTEHDTLVKVPKSFVKNENGGASYPHNNPNWLNLIQQAYVMEAQSTKVSNQHFDTRFFEGLDCPGYANMWFNNFKFTLLIDIPLKTSSINKEELSSDCSSDILRVAHTKGLTKNLLMDSNVIQIGTAGHAVALFFGNGKVHYYDNVYFPAQVDVYGVEGPVYEEAEFFRGKDIVRMSEEDFFSCLFKEIKHRLAQVAKIREWDGFDGMETICFFERSLVDQSISKF